MNRTLLSWSLSVVVGLAVGSLGGLVALRAFGGERPAATVPAVSTAGPTVTPSAAPYLEPPPPLQQGVSNSRRTAIVDATEKVHGSVVTVFVTERIRSRGFDDPFGFFGPQEYEQQGLGSGIVVSRDGYIVTNDHVVGNADRITVQMADGRRFDGVVVDTDPNHDLAVLKIDPPEDIQAARLGDSMDILVGEWVIALGSPFGFDLRDPQPSVSVGVVSAVGRSFVTTSGGVTRYFPSTIQTDAAINPGNSGGPLVNTLGEVIGINSFIYSQTGGSVGIGFAIPVREVEKALAQIRSYGRIRRAWTGLRSVDNSIWIVMRNRVADRVGAVVSEVEASSPAERAGLKTGAVIISADGQAVRGQQDLEAVLVRKDIDDSVELEYLDYPDGRQRRTTLTVVEDPRTPRR
jgi:serine protease Do